ncbi:MAG: SUMF1/EgtB/PvdO family nonheme iron enzyme [Candidatus Contendobacter sp.]|nr:SUMF1/EgtB/PvdO family nonheme iron enzyme [Candidatus Contendobacter sp.]
MAENRSALIVAVSEYQDAGLRQLVAPPQDAEALARVLKDPTIGGFAIKTLLNQPACLVNREIEAFFTSGAKDDLLLLYFSGHGLKDAAGRLHFATIDTDRKLLRSTTISAALLHDLMNDCDSRRQVLLLDCCYSGAFARGKTHHKAGETVDIGEYFGQGRGQFVLTASDALQYAFEGDAVSGEGVCSIFTDTLVRGLETGEADLDGDGKITCDELYAYLHGRVTDRMPQQKPRKWAFAAEGNIIIARNPRPIIKPVALPAELRESIEDPRPWVREGAARHLGDLLQNGNKGLAAAAQVALQGMAEDDSLKVRAVVAEILKAAPPPTKPPEPASDKAKARPALPTIQNVHGWSAQQVQTLQQETAQAFGLTVEFCDRLQDGSEGPTMVVVPGGRFLMGSPPDEPERRDSERQHEVEVAPFALGKFAATFEEYDRFATATNREKPSDKDWGRGRRPVINVSWLDAVAYAEWLSQQTGQTYRLPTEAEWEYACRAGTTTPFSLGTTISTEQANYDGNYVYGKGQKGVYQQETVEVGQFPANSWGLHEVHGNVWEWTGSEYAGGYGGAELQTISDPNSGGSRVLRGGSWDSEPEGLRSAARFWFNPRTGDLVAGFRLARTLTL